MNQYAAYDQSAIYAIGDTPDAAIAKARDETRDPDSTFEIAKIGAADALEIQDRGFDGHRDSFEVKNGWIILDPHRRDR